MKLKLRACLPTTRANFEYGTMVLKGRILLKFIEDDNMGILKTQYSPSLFPIKPNTYTVNFLNEINEHHENFQAKIQIKDSFHFYVKLNWIQKTKLRWMLKEYDIQSKEMKMDIYKYIIGGMIGLVFSFISYLTIQKYSAEPQTPPKAGIQKSLEPKNLIKRDK